MLFPESWVPSSHGACAMMRRMMAMVAMSACALAPAGAQSGLSSIDTRVSLFLADGNTYTATPPENTPPGGGFAPLAINLLAGTGRVLTLSAEGSSFFCQNNQCLASTPDGPSIGNTNINSSGRIAGLNAASSGFLAALFLDDGLPLTAPERLTIPSIDFLTLSPLLGQTFFVGNGTTSGGVTQQFFVPDGATRLYFGIVDGGSFQGEPGFYGDNQGAYRVSYNVSAVPEPGTFGLLASGVVGLAFLRRRRA
ncbi:MAG: hypothetical protein C0516_02825 [Gemmatimonas sp.]|nr:hypothetical protein [Gemmatimonas sp.]